MAAKLADLDNGKTVSMTRGDAIEVRLKGNPTTGYIWEESGSIGVSLTESSYQADVNPQGFVGVGGTFWFRFRAEGGPGRIQLLYRRPWEKAAPPANTYSVTIQSDAATATVGGVSFSQSTLLAVGVASLAVLITAVLVWRRSETSLGSSAHHSS
ncbi:hypothetical protein HDU93_008852 [Gonapodya sp. JEL0774]|nr:hypothetical protein HDU93_008852 [Gonapodya sp. JEL0774]